MNNRSQKLIILKLQSNDKEAISDFYKEYEDPIFRFIFFRVTDRETARDMTQEVFIKFLEITDKRAISDLKAYLYKIARNLVIDFYKKQDKFQVIGLDQTAEVTTILGKEATEAKLDLEAIIKATDQLKHVWREIVLLRIVEGFEYKEIASILGKSENYIRVNLHRALKELRVRK